MFRTMRGSLLCVAACSALTLNARADIIETTLVDLLADAGSQPTVDAAQTEASAADDSTSAGSKPNESETIRERYPDGTVKVERQVVQDASGNYVNHGKWTMFDEKQRVVASGEFRYGERQGLWTRWHPLTIKGKDMFSQPPYKNFKAPFVSEVSFDNGRLHGSWAIYDSQDRKCSEFVFEHGERQGKSIWYYPNGDKMREIDFSNGQLDGQWQEWGAGKSVTMNEKYEGGRRLGRRTEKYPNGQTKNDATYLFAREVITSDYDWWNGTITTKVEREGKDQRHGHYVSFHKNGQKDEEGEYVNDLPVGKFTWWFATGQKASEGQFVNGDRNGHWTWWHENGQKSVSGDFVKGVEIGKWTWWKEDGKVANSARITEGKTKVSTEATVSTEPVTTTIMPTAPEVKQPPQRQATRNVRRAPTPAVRR